MKTEDLLRGPWVRIPLPPQIENTVLIHGLIQCFLMCSRQESKPTASVQVVDIFPSSKYQATFSTPNGDLNDKTGTKPALSFQVLPPGVEPGASVPQTDVLSIKLREHISL